MRSYHGDAFLHDHGTSEGSVTYRAGDAEFERVMVIIARQLGCGETCADFIAAQHLFCHEQACEAWIDLGIRMGRYVCTNEQRGLYTLAAA